MTVWFNSKSAALGVQSLYTWAYLDSSLSKYFFGPIISKTLSNGYKSELHIKGYNLGGLPKASPFDIRSL